MKPSKWSKFAWPFLHLLVLEYPENPTNDDKNNYRIWITYLGFVLPCNKCANNFQNNLKKLPLSDKVLSSRENLCTWMIDMHNLVNLELDKRLLTYDEALDEIEKMMSDNNNYINSICPKPTNNNFWLYMVIFVLILIICYLVFIRKN